MSTNEDHPLRQQGTFSEPKAKLSDRFFAAARKNIEEFDKILQINEGICITFWITTALVLCAVFILGICVTVDLYGRFMPAGHETTETLQQCQQDLHEEQERTSRYESLISDSVLQEDRLFR
jgi:hypothetical protein